MEVRVADSNTVVVVDLKGVAAWTSVRRRRLLRCDNDDDADPIDSNDGGEKVATTKLVAAGRVAVASKSSNSTEQREGMDDDFLLILTCLAINWMTPLVKKSLMPILALLVLNGHEMSKKL